VLIAADRSDGRTLREPWMANTSTWLRPHTFDPTAAPTIITRRTGFSCARTIGRSAAGEEGGHGGPSGSDFRPLWPTPLMSRYGVKRYFQLTRCTAYRR